MAVIDFWTTGLNPITLHPVYTDVVSKTSRKKTDSYKVCVPEDLKGNEIYILAKEAQNILGLGAQRIREAVDNNGIEFKVYKSRDVLYYKRSHIEGIEIVIQSSFVIPDEYISGVELRALKNWTSWDLWSNSNKNGWAKKKFRGNITYYLKSEVL